MSKDIEPTYLETIATTIDIACTACHNSDTDADGADQRSLINSTLDGLARTVNAHGEQGTKFIQGLKRECGACLENHRQPIAALETKYSCGIRRESWKLMRRPNFTNS